MQKRAVSTGYLFFFFEYPVTFQPLPLWYEEKHFMWPCSELLWLCLSHELHQDPHTVLANWHKKFYLYSIQQPPTVTQLCNCSKVSVHVMPNYSRMLSVASGYCKNQVAFLEKMLYAVIQAGLWHTNFIHEHVPRTLRAWLNIDQGHQITNRTVKFVFSCSSVSKQVETPMILGIHVVQMTSLHECPHLPQTT